MSLEIINTLKKMLKGIDTLRGVLYNHHARHQQDGTDDLESLLRLANLAEKAHSSLTGVTANQHHAQAHTLASHTTKAHSELTGVTASQHHSKTSKLSEITIDVIKDWQKKNITNLGAGAHDLNAKLNSIITKLSELTIDADKNWQGKAISNPGKVDGVDVSAHAANVNAHHTKFTTTEHDTTTRHPVSVIKTATGSAAGDLGAKVEINIGMNRKSFAPQITTGNNDAIATGTYGTASDPNDYVGRFQIWNDSEVAIPYWIRWDYLSSSGPPVIWTITDDKGKIIHCWESGDAPDSDNPDLAPIELLGEDMPTDWHSLKINVPSDYKEMKNKAREKKKSLSKHILDDYEVDIKTKKLKKKIEEV